MIATAALIWIAATVAALQFFGFHHP